MKHYARDSNIFMFTEIATSNLQDASILYDELIEKDKEIDKCIDNDEASFLSHESDPLRSNLSKKSSTAIIFSAMALEAYIYDYAARELGDSFVQKHLDKLDLASKYVIAIQLIRKVHFPKDKEVFYQLRKLIRTRNDLIHSKSNKMDFDNSESLNKMANFHYHIYESATDSKKAMVLMANYIASIDPDEQVSMYLPAKQTIIPTI